MWGLLLAAVVSQAPVEPPVTLANTPVTLPPCGDVKLAAQFIDRHLLSVGLEAGFATTWVVRSAERAFRPGELREAMRLVPDAHAVADRADGEYRLGLGFMVAGLIAEGVALVASVVVLPVISIAGTSAALALVLVPTLGALLLGAGLSLASSVFLQNSQQHGLEAVAAYNHGLTRVVVGGCDGPAAAPVVQVPLP